MHKQYLQHEQTEMKLLPVFLKLCAGPIALGPAISYYLCMLTMFTRAMSSVTPVARSDFDEMTEGGKTVSPIIVASDLCPKVSKLGIASHAQLMLL